LWLFSSFTEKCPLQGPCLQAKPEAGRELSELESKLCSVSQHCSQDDAIPSSTKLLSAQSREIHI
jgi:hypothetical protein